MKILAICTVVTLLVGYEAVARQPFNNDFADVKWLKRFECVHQPNGAQPTLLSRVSVGFQISHPSIKVLHIDGMLDGSSCVLAPAPQTGDVIFVDRNYDTLKNGIEYLDTTMESDDSYIVSLNSSGGESSIFTTWFNRWRQLKKSLNKPFTTYVGNGRFCYSACVDLFRQGENRTAYKSTQFFWHSGYRGFTAGQVSREIILVPVEENLANMRIKGYSENFIKMIIESHALETNEGKYFSSDFLKDFDFVTDVVSLGLLGD